MSRITFWVINLLGAYLLLTRDHDESFSLRLLLGVALIVIGTLGIVLMHILPRLRAKPEAEERDDSKES
ncbi:MAG: hypothetical protein V1899_04835 [Planctomycetota bacterium]